ncbi:MAG TPA: hypothetical protein VFE91_03760 [Nitrososphaerales archaeon]|nr:hypothetical protein [Nitrososphaerales archaeon]
MSSGFFAGSMFIRLQVIMLVALQVTAALVLWLLSPTTQPQTDTFALFLSVDLLAFAILSYQYRARRNGGLPNAAWVSVGYLVLVMLLSANLLIH